METIVMKSSNDLRVDENIEEIHDKNKCLKPILKESKWKIIKESNQRIVPRFSQGEIKLSNIIEELQKISIESQQGKKTDDILINNSSNCIEISRRRLAHILLLPKFHYSIIVLVIIDLIVVLIDLVLAQLSSPCLTDTEMLIYNTTNQRDSCLLPYSLSLSRGELFLFYFSVLLLIIFVFEIFISFYAFGLRHYTNPLYLLDSLIVFTSFIMELYFHYGNLGRAGRAAAAIVVLRLWKIVRAIHAVVHSIILKNRLIIKKIQEAQILIEQEKESTEKMLEKQDIKVEYLTNLLKTYGKLPSNQQINNYVENLWKQRYENEN
ncbi:hypothetical protein I4U23_027680 [Adineta vaga]|nr:hypothetical protein I4U23_027680 [Adineta vaga]